MKLYKLPSGQIVDVDAHCEKVEDGYRLTCMCCGHRKVFANLTASFNAGWDAPPHFTGYVCCNLCPGSFVVLGCTDKHKEAHDRWAEKGRPSEFEIPREKP